MTRNPEFAAYGGNSHLGQVVRSYILANNVHGLVTAVMETDMTSGALTEAYWYANEMLTTSGDGKIVTTAKWLLSHIAADQPFTPTNLVLHYAAVSAARPSGSNGDAFRLMRRGNFPLQDYITACGELDPLVMLHPNHPPAAASYWVKQGRVNGLSIQNLHSASVNILMNPANTDATKTQLCALITEAPTAPVTELSTGFDCITWGTLLAGRWWESYKDRTVELFPQALISATKSFPNFSGGSFTDEDDQLVQLLGNPGVQRLPYGDVKRSVGKGYAGGDDLLWVAHRGTSLHELEVFVTNLGGARPKQVEQDVCVTTVSGILPAAVVLNPNCTVELMQRCYDWNPDAVTAAVKLYPLKFPTGFVYKTAVGVATNATAGRVVHPLAFYSSVIRERADFNFDTFMNEWLHFPEKGDAHAEVLISFLTVNDERSVGNIDKFIKHPWRAIRTFPAAGSSNIDTLRVALTDPEIVVRSAAAWNTNVTYGTVTESPFWDLSEPEGYSRNGMESVRFWYATHPDTPEGVLRMLPWDSDLEIRELVKVHPNVSPELRLLCGLLS